MDTDKYKYADFLPVAQSLKLIYGIHYKTGSDYEDRYLERTLESHNRQLDNYEDVIDDKIRYEHLDIKE
jgi:hypothetical protein